MSYLRLLSKPAFGLSILPILVLLIASLVFTQVNQLKREREWLTHTYIVIDNIDQLMLKLTQAESMQRRYMTAQDDEGLAQFRAVIGKAGNPASDADTIEGKLEKLRLLTADSSIQQEHIDALEELIHRKIDFMQQMVAIAPVKSMAEIKDFAKGRGLGMMNTIKSITQGMEEQENKLLKIRTERAANSAHWVMLTSIGLSALVVLMLAFAFWMIQRELARRLTAEKAMREINAFQKALLQESPYAIISADLSGKITLFNPMAEKMLGYRADEVIGKLVPTTFHLEEEIAARAIELSAEFGRHIEPNNEVFVVKPGISGPEQREWTYRRKDGSTFPVQVVVTAMPDGHGGVVGYFGMVEDITERKEIERMKNEFVSTVSHELRTPLTSIRGSLGLILADVAGPMANKVRDLITIAYNNSERLVRLINDILDIEKIESGNIVVTLRPLPIGPLLRQAIEENTGYAEKYAVNLAIEDQTGDAAIMGSQDHLLQVFTNLLSNAMKFSPPQGTVTLGATLAEGRVRFGIVDNGPGIPEDFQARIFEKFTQADSSSTRAKNGTGLGLSISKALVEKMQGTIGFDSAPGRTEFFIDLPLAAQLEQPIPAFAAETGTGTRRVLIVEDSPDIASLLRIILRQEGLESEIAGSAAAARALLKAQDFAAMTLDLELPDQDGLLLLQELRADPQTVRLPVIVISIRSEEGRQAMNGQAIGILDWLQKPIDIERLKRVLRTVAATGTIPAIIHVEDDTDMAEVISLSLAGKATFTHAGTLAAAREQLGRQTYDLAILDLKLPDGNGLDLLPVLAERSPPIPVIILSASETPKEIQQLVQASLVKSVVSEEKIARIIQDAIRGSELP